MRTLIFLRLKLFSYYFFSNFSYFFSNFSNFFSSFFNCFNSNFFFSYFFSSFFSFVTASGKCNCYSSSSKEKSNLFHFFQILNDKYLTKNRVQS